MEIYNLQDDIKVFCATAKSFPEGVQEAFIKLETMLSKEGRTFYGISYKNRLGEIVYKAAVSENYEGESEKYGFETFTIRKGEYLTEKIINWMTNMHAFGETFQKLLSDPRLDTTGYCLEWYKSDEEVDCMVKINTPLKAL